MPKRPPKTNGCPTKSPAPGPADGRHRSCCSENSADLRLAEEAVRQLHLSGYIPTSSSLELASTALRLVIAGGRYFPEKCLDADKATPTTSQAPASSAHYVKLTTREAAVLELLEHGLPNKIIANRLRMSQSTVKAHVHNIIAKLNVRNRTEAAVARYAASASVISSPCLICPHLAPHESVPAIECTTNPAGSRGFLGHRLTDSKDSQTFRTDTEPFLRGHRQSRPAEPERRIAHQLLVNC